MGRSRYRKEPVKGIDAVDTSGVSVENGKKMLIRYSQDARGRAVRTALVYTKREHAIDPARIDPEALRVISHLKNYGYDAYVVGGAVRDLLIGKEPKDFDIVTNAEPTKIKRLFRNSRIIGKRFRLVHIFFGEKIFEVSTFRSTVDGTTGNAFGTIDEDVRRRDFTMNALYYDPIKEQIVDYVGGVKDIRSRKIKPVIPLSLIFKDDPVRLLRAVKYAVSTGCSMPFRLSRAIKRDAPLLAPVSPSRLTEEIIKILNSGKSNPIVSMLLRFDLFMYLQPSACALIDDCKGFSSSYAKSLEALDALVSSEESVRLGQKIAFMIRDLVSIVTDWNGQPQEVWTRVYNECRRFIMPMNPPRVELEFAVKQCLKDGGMTVRAPRTRDRRLSHGGGAPDAIDASPAEGTSTRRPRRRRHRKPGPPISATT